jgi:tRNA threonylcarbamoyladenosine biosynthesis protein TsaE
LSGVELRGRVDLEAGALTETGVEAWGRRIGEAAVAGDIALPLVLALRGELGAGKSVLARAVARGAGVTSPMPSPTFNLVFRYDAAAGIEVYHVDLYRLVDPDEVWELGWRDLGSGRQIVLIEWPERAESLLPADRWDVWLADASHAGAEQQARARAEAVRPGGGETVDLRWVWGARRGDASDIPRPED